jgi:hypothetical protein
MAKGAGRVEVTADGADPLKSYLKKAIPLCGTLEIREKNRHLRTFASSTLGYFFPIFPECAAGVASREMLVR